jgi:hypothetical protein
MITHKTKFHIEMKLTNLFIQIAFLFLFGINT